MKTQQANYTIRAHEGRYQVFDRNQHYRCSFATKADAEAYIATKRQTSRQTTKLTR